MQSWDDAEIETLVATYPLGGYALVTKRLPSRSKSSIYSMANKLNLRFKEKKKPVQFMQPEVIAKGMGVSLALVGQWIVSKSLETRLRHGHQVVTPASLRRWLALHPKCIDLAKVDRTWFLALAFPCKGNGGEH